MSTPSQQTEKRGFRIDKHAIMTLIGAQAGSLQKALLEAVANSQDAGATRVDITLSPTQVLIEDDGRGFVSREEIDQFFDNFGFDHAALGRTVGRFGVGRGQLFSFGRNRWTTHQFSMDVDIETKGLDYELTTSASITPGMRIAIELYRPLDSSPLLQVEKEFKKLVRYSPVPVFLNGKQLSIDPATREWTAQTQQAWIKLDDSHAIAVYSQGLFVQNVSSYEFGRGGVVVTKLGYPLSQNLARNDLLRDKCPVWKAIRKSIQSMSGANRALAVAGKAKMTDGLRASLALEAMASPTPAVLETFVNAALITLTNGKHVRIGKMAGFPEVTGGPDHSPSADRLIQAGQAAVLSPSTLARFGVEDAPSLIAALRQQAEILTNFTRSCTGPSQWMPPASSLWGIRSRLSAIKAAASMKDLTALPTDGFEIIASTTWTKDEKLSMRALRHALLSISGIVRTHLEAHDKLVTGAPVLRNLDLMVSDTMLACTDGTTHIWINRPHHAACMKKGPSGFVALCQTMVHELLHDRASSTGHDHDHEFYEMFHDICSDPDITQQALRSYRHYLALGGTAAIADLTAMESMGQMDTADAIARHDALVQMKADPPVASGPRHARERKSVPPSRHK